MYAVAARLDPDSYLALATVTFREMVAAGITCVGEFHYLHHQPDGTPYDDPNAMGRALIEAARTAGLRITLLDTCYLTAGHRPAGRGRAAPVQRRRRRRLGARGSPRSSAPTVRGSAAPTTRSARCRATRCGRGTAVAAAHPPLRAGRGERAVPGGVRHDARRRSSPRRATSRERNTLVHATHLTDDDVRLIGEARRVRRLLPDDRARPRRRHRPEPRAARRRRAGSRSAPTATRSSTCSRRCARSSSTSGSPRSSAGTGPPPSCSTAGDPARLPRLGRRRPDRGRLPRRPGHDRRPTACAPPGPAPTSTPPSSPPSPRTSPTSSSTAASSSGEGDREQLGRDLADRDRPDLGDA